MEEKSRKSQAVGSKVLGIATPVCGLVRNDRNGGNTYGSGWVDYIGKFCGGGGMRHREMVVRSAREHEKLEVRT